MKLTKYLDCEHCKYKGISNCIKFGLSFDEINRGENLVYFSSETMKLASKNDLFIKTNKPLSKNNPCPFSPSIGVIR